MATRNELRAAKLVKMLREARDHLDRVEVFDRAANEADELRGALDRVLIMAGDFETANAEYTDDELRED
jgi:hypothetical protein